ncbi:hypothetical protein JCM6882_004802 [Rhodosporidiobolus microsporus]
MLTKTALSALLLLGASLADAAPVKTQGDAAVANSTVDAEAVISELAADKTGANRRHAKRAVVSIPLVQSQGKYAAMMQAGTPAQTIPVIIDTGSSDLLLNGAVYDTAASSSLSDSGKDISFSFVSGAFDGSVATETINLGGNTVAKQTVGVINEPDLAPAGGILGLNFPNLAKASPRTFFSNLVSSGQLAANKFGLYLNRDPAGASELTLGGANSAHYSTSLTRNPVVEGMGDWAVQITGFLSSGGPSLVTQDTTAFIDSGNGFSVIPAAAAAAIYASIPGASSDGSFPMPVAGNDVMVDSYKFPCSNTVRPGYRFSGNARRAYQLQLEDFIVGRAEDGETCYGSIYGADVNLGTGNLALLGTDFLKSFYAVFNVEDPSYYNKPTISFAPSA